MSEIEKQSFEEEAGQVLNPAAESAQEAENQEVEVDLSFDDPEVVPLEEELDEDEFIPEEEEDEAEEREVPG